jgi:hypothetical protein
MYSLFAWTTAYECNARAILNSMKRLDLDLTPILNFGEFLFGQRNAKNVMAGNNRGRAGTGGRGGLQVRYVRMFAG